MNIIIVGAGRIGRNLAKTLSEENNEVHLVEPMKPVADKVSEKLDVKVVVGSGSDPETLEKASIRSADLVLAVTTTDEVNLLVCSLAAAYGVKRKIARVRNTALRDIVKEFGLDHFYVNDLINPELVAAEAIVKTIETPGASEVGDFASGQILLRGFHVPNTSPLCGSRLGELADEDFPWPFLIISIVRNEEVIFPKGDAVVQEDDHIYVLLPKNSLAEFVNFVNPELTAPKKIIIYGATITGKHLALTLSHRISNITIIEEDPDLAREVSDSLEQVVVINGSASDAEILNECGVEAADVFIATSKNDHSNLISSVLAKKMGAKTTIITTQRPEYMSIIDALDIDAIINPHYLAVEQILQMARGRSVSSVTKLMECDSEAIELIPEKNAPITRDMLKGIKLPKNSIVGAVLQGNNVSLAKGDTKINEGDKVIVFCQHSVIKKVQALFTSK
ncbi:MAG: Trk system potassium transporter TrkA [Candidatus Omnitrophica bacterium]|nr:Trk system potassium transporter TrkA [Candidatus Omnitrophota bacterium]